MAQILESKNNDIKKDIVHIINYMSKELEKKKSMLGIAMETEPNVFYRWKVESLRWKTHQARLMTD